MSNLHLPAEILDYIIDHLHDEEVTLRNCCLVSKSWVPRARKHLFDDIAFYTVRDAHSWKRTFPDPLTSPAYYAKTLFIDCSELGADRTEPDFNQSATPLTPFHGFSPALKSLCIIIPALPSSQFFDLILSFPLLEDFDVVLLGPPPDNGDGSEEDEVPTATQPPSLPTFTGSLELYLMGGMRPFVRRLLSPPGGIHFRKLTLTWCHEEDHLSTTALAEGCSHTLETLDIDWNLPDWSRTGFVDLTKATKLKEVVFRPNAWTVEWITTTLQTITAKHRDLRQISIQMYRSILAVDLREAVGEPGCGEWAELDRFLVRLWESHSICPTVTFATRLGTRGSIGCLLPETTKRGIIGLGEFD